MSTICDMCCRTDCEIEPLNLYNCNSVRWYDENKDKKANYGWHKGDGRKTTPLELERSLKSNVKWID